MKFSKFEFWIRYQKASCKFIKLFRFQSSINLKPKLMKMPMLMVMTMLVKMNKLDCFIFSQAQLALWTYLKFQNSFLCFFFVSCFFLVRCFELLLYTQYIYKKDRVKLSVYLFFFYLSLPSYQFIFFFLSFSVKLSQNIKQLLKLSVYL